MTATTLTDKPSYAMCDKVKTISTDRLRNRHKRTLTGDEITAIRTAIRRIVDV